MREIRTSGLMSGMWKRGMAEILGHSLTKGRANREPKPRPTTTAPHLDSTGCSRAKAPNVRQIGPRAAMSDAGIVDTTSRSEERARPEMACSWRLQPKIHE